MKALARRLRGLGLRVKQPQDFTPTPGTISTAMYVTGFDRYTKKTYTSPKPEAKEGRRERFLKR